MTSFHDDRLRTALASLATGHSGTVDDIPLPPLFRARAIVLLWIALAVTVVGLLALARIRVPRVVQGVAVAVATGADSVSLMLLLPREAKAYVRPGQRATVDVGDGSPVELDVAAVDQMSLDARSARRRYPGAPQVLAHLETPKVAAVLSPCRIGPSCLTLQAGATYPATASLGTRTLASYAWSSTPAPSR